MLLPPIIDPHNWVKNHADYLYRYTLSRINDEDQARDLVQETFLAALERVDKFEGKSTERTWLTAILRNKIVDVYRKKSSGLGTINIDSEAQDPQDYFEQDGHWKEEHWPMAFGVEDVDPLHNKEFNKVLQKCMQKLPALWLAVFTMKHIDDEPTNTICAELKVSDANFWVIIHRAKLNLRACLQKNWI
ncbi:RNA polymerase factor sigma-70 [Mucilaginibacter puniceus]